MTCKRERAAVGLVHRDQHQIRKRLLLRLGITSCCPATGAPSITRGTVQSIPKLSCRRSDCSFMDSAPIQQENTSQPSQQHRVRFAQNVALHEIPSHRDYDEEIRQQIWMGTKEIEINARRNRLEYRADGFDYQKATEESGFLPWNGELVHPATYWMRYQEEQEQRLLEEAHELVYGTKATSSAAATAVGISSIKRSPTITSLAGMAA